MSLRFSSPVGPVVAALIVVPGLAIAQTRTPFKVAAPRTFQVYTPPVGPPPQSIGFDLQRATHVGVSVKVDWPAAPNAVSYGVSRRMLEDPTCCTANSGLLTTPTWTDNGLLRQGTYMFTVTVNYADGSVGSGEAGIGAAGIENPSPVTVHALPNGKLLLNWPANIPGAVGYMVGGPGFGVGKQVPFPSPLTGAPPGLPPLTIVGPLPLGTHTWTVATVYGNNMGILSPSSNWSTVSHTVNYGSGRYRISLERFQALTDLPEDLLRGDGRGNEVYLTAQVNEYGLDGRLVSGQMLRTPTFGDVQNFPGRVRAGSASQTGGLRNGDEYPAAVQWVSQLATPTMTNLPYQLWEGDLTEFSGAVIISPAIWDADGDDRLLPYYMTYQTTGASSLVNRQTLQWYVPRSDGSGTKIDTWNPVKCPGGSFYAPQAQWLDQPIDMSGNSFCPLYVAINWRVAQSLTHTNPAAVMDVPFSTGNGQYKLYIRVEKVQTTATVAPAVMRRRMVP